jgi:hypothetical protein
MQRNIIVSVVVVILVVLLLPILLVKVGGWRNQGGSGHGLQQEYDRIRAEGQPVTFEELDAWYERPADNAADLYLKAFNAHVEPSPGLESKLPWEKGGAALPPEGQPLPDAMRLAIQEYVRQNNGSIALLREAVTHPHCRYPIDLRKGFAADIPHLAKIRRSARLLADQALLLADTGNPDGSVESVVGVFTLANSLQDEPILISQLVRVACAQIGIDALTRVVNRAPLDNAQLTKLSDALDPYSNEGAFWRAYVGERCIQIGLWDTRMGPGPGAVPVKLDLEAIKKYTQSPVFENDLAYMLHFLDLTIQGTKLPPDEGQSKLQEAAKLAEQAPADYLISRGKGPFENASATASFVRSAQERERIVSASRTAAAALSVNRH